MSDLTDAQAIVDGLMPAAQIFVSPRGNDLDAGTEFEPLKTLTAAQTAARALGLGDKGIDIVLLNGDYPLTTGLALTVLDSGEAAKPVTWKSYTKDTSRVLGSTSLSASWFTLMTSGDDEWARVDPLAQGEVYICDLGAHGITDYGTFKRRGFGWSNRISALELVVNDDALALARWPKAGDDVSGFTEYDTNPTQTTFTVAGTTATRMARWETAPEMRAHGYYRYYYADDHNSVTMVLATKTFTLPNTPGLGMVANRLFYVYNLLEELTQAGEWYLEHSTGILYYWPDGDITTQDIAVSMAEEALVTTSSADYINFKGITFGAGRSHLAEVDGGTDVTFSHCDFFAAGNNALHLDGTNHSLLRSEISGSGDGGVMLDGGVKATLVSGNNVVENCNIHHFGRFSLSYKPGINMTGVGQRASHNHVHYGPHVGIQYLGNDHIMEYNEVDNVVNNSSDMGAFYTNLDWHNRGNEVNFNYVHDITSDIPGIQVGIYMDGAIAGIKVFGNYIIDISNRGIFHQGGLQTPMENNIIVRCLEAALNTNHTGTNFINDTPGDKWNFLEKLQVYDHQNPPWSLAYPDCALIPNDQATILDDANGWRFSRDSIFSRNLGWDNTAFIVEGQTDTLIWFAGVTDNVPDSDPLFVDEAGGDLNLEAGSPANSIPGWTYIDFDAIGIED